MPCGRGSDGTIAVGEPFGVSDRCCGGGAERPRFERRMTARIALHAPFHRKLDKSVAHCRSPRYDAVGSPPFAGRQSSDSLCCTQDAGSRPVTRRPVVRAMSYSSIVCRFTRWSHVMSRRWNLLAVLVALSPSAAAETRYESAICCTPAAGRRAAAADRPAREGLAARAASAARRARAATTLAPMRTSTAMATSASPISASSCRTSDCRTPATKTATWTATETWTWPTSPGCSRVTARRWAELMLLVARTEPPRTFQISGRVARHVGVQRGRRRIVNAAGGAE